MPVDNIRSIPAGMPVEVTGTVNAAQPLVSPVTKKPCVYFKYEVQQQEKTYDQNTHTSTQHWSTINKVEQSIPFYLQDPTGQVLIKPDGCEVNGIYQTEQMGKQYLNNMGDQNPLKDHKLLTEVIDTAVAVGGPTTRIFESAIFVGSSLNVFGSQTLEDNVVVIQNTKEYPLVLTTKTQDQLIKSEDKIGYILYIFAIITFVLGVSLFFIIH